MQIIKAEKALDNRWLVIHDDGTQEYAVMPANVTTAKQAQEKWVVMQEEFANPPEPVTNKREMMKELFFDVMAEQIEAGNLNMTLKDIVGQVDNRMKEKSRT